eukprot:2738723-Rhodomonas_salina.4
MGPYALLHEFVLEYDAAGKLLRMSYAMPGTHMPYDATSAESTGRLVRSATLCYLPMQSLCNTQY